MFVRKFRKGRHQGFSHVYVHFIFGPYYVFTILIIQIAAVGGGLTKSGKACRNGRQSQFDSRECVGILPHLVDGCDSYGRGGINSVMGGAAKAP